MGGRKLTWDAVDAMGIGEVRSCFAFLGILKAKRERFLTRDGRSRVSSHKLYVIPWPVPGIQVFAQVQDVDGRHKAGHNVVGVIPGEPEAREGDPLTRSVG